MSAGRGITDSEFNASQTELVHSLQIWIPPEQAGLVSSYEQKSIDLSAERGSLSPIASRRGGPGVVKLHQDTTISVALLEPGESLQWSPSRQRYAWVQLARGGIALNEHALSAGDGAGADDTSGLRIEAHESSEILRFNLG